MKKILAGLAILQLTACSQIFYPDWEYVRIEDHVPDKACVYKMQEACSRASNLCLNWHKQRATKFDANTVVITSKEKMSSFAGNGWLGVAKGGESSSTVAEYYACNTAKNIVPK